MNHGIAPHPNHGHANAPAAGNDIMRQASSLVGSPSSDMMSGARSETTRGEPKKGEANDDEGTSPSGKQVNRRDR